MLLEAPAGELCLVTDSAVGLAGIDLLVQFEYVICVSEDFSPSAMRSATSGGTTVISQSKHQICVECHQPAGKRENTNDWLSRF